MSDFYWRGSVGLVWWRTWVILVYCGRSGHRSKENGHTVLRYLYHVVFYVVDLSAFLIGAGQGIHPWYGQGVSSWSFFLAIWCEHGSLVFLPSCRRHSSFVRWRKETIMTDLYVMLLVITQSQKIARKEPAVSSWYGINIESASGSREVANG